MTKSKGGKLNKSMRWGWMMGDNIHDYIGISVDGCNCFKCDSLIDEIVNIDDRKDRGQFIYICVKCAAKNSPLTYTKCNAANDDVV